MPKKKKGKGKGKKLASAEASEEDRSKFEKYVQNGALAFTVLLGAAAAAAIADEEQAHALMQFMKNTLEPSSLLGWADPLAQSLTGAWEPAAMKESLLSFGFIFTGYGAANMKWKSLDRLRHTAKWRHVPGQALQRMCRVVYDLNLLRFSGDVDLLFIFYAFSGPESRMFAEGTGAHVRHERHVR